MQRVLRNAEDAPSAFLEFMVYREVMPTVVGDLVGPEFVVSFRGSVALRTAVPEAAVDENRKTLIAEREVGLAR